MANEKKVDIHFDGKKITVDPDSVPVSIEKEEHVFWTLIDDAKLVSIEFKTNPFDRTVEIDSTKKHATSTTVTNPNHKNKKFKYTVTVEDNVGKRFSLDPDVQVMP